MLIIPSVCFSEDVQVNGYYRKDGTYVAPHTRSRPNAYQWDNKSYEPSQPAYNSSYSQPTKNYGSDWNKPSETRYQDSNPYNDSPPNNQRNGYGTRKRR
ncbi:MAG: hypothetical protein ACKVQV_14000 [Bacteroidia bacterium]